MRRRASMRICANRHPGELLCQRRRTRRTSAQLVAFCLHHRCNFVSFFVFVRSVCPTHASSCALARCLFNEHQMQNVCRRARTRELKKEKKTITAERIFSGKNPLEQNIEMGVCVCALKRASKLEIYILVCVCASAPVYSTNR